MSSPIKHTPGPWALDERGNVVTPSGELLIVSGIAQPHGVHPQAGEAEANARLLASAPDLLEALKAVMGRFIGGRQFATAEETATIEQANAAIAKAEGRQ